MGDKTTVTRDFDIDVAIVGSGFGGPVSALQFSEKGYRVTVLEKGKRWRTEDLPKSNRYLRKSFSFPWIRCHGTWTMHLLREVLVLHLPGGCCIGAGRDSGVIDSSGRVFGHEGLYVTDASMIGANQSVNLSHTITLLAEHAYSKVLANPK